MTVTVYPNRDWIVDRFGAAPAALPATDQVRLFTTDLGLTGVTPFASFIEPTDTWYDPAADGIVTYQQPYIDPDTGLLVIGGLEAQYDWTAVDAAVEIDIWGWFVSNTGGTAWKFAGKFDSPVTLGDTLSSIRVTPKLLVPILRLQRYP